MIVSRSAMMKISSHLHPLRRLRNVILNHSRIDSGKQQNQLNFSLFKTHPHCFYYAKHSFSTDSESVLTPSLINVMEKRMSGIEARYAHLEQTLSKPAVMPEEFARANKEFKKLEDCISLIKNLRVKKKEIDGLRVMASDSLEEKEMRDLAVAELPVMLEEERNLQYKLLQCLLPKDDADGRDCILEVRAGTGGEEASLFAMDLFKMYERYAQKRRWKFEVVDVTESDLRGYKEACAAISGAGVYGKLKFESGVHRVQRIPVTEKAGRIHTSAASVAILPQADDVDVKLRHEDLRIDTFRSGGAGGQSVNTTSSAVRVTHIPTGIVISIQDERSQHQNKAKALKVLCAKLYERERQRLHASRSKLRSDQIGSGDRSERIRTYNFPQGRVTDHRVGITLHSIEDIMLGEGLDDFVDALVLKLEMDAIASFTDTS
ncbi:hypothetical protein SUGI_0386810 [Cryptomeria japonica]|uniref:peptide chain release factor 1, mitochondrial isoform X2 n=2 Tax=Cryptomeria japonica TaxID=3369 RepID=UPI002408C571|nr:peptide chain release factor 1, mitochondrial isoform X2 [Cryptomeria japonica]GLJ21146.1 hypothetical protein SUGI_0386810 [Cryptomeria japonica]